MPKSDLRIDLLGTSFTITVDEEPVYLNTLLNRYSRIIDNTQKSTGLSDPLKISLLAGFMLCDEAEKLRSNKHSTTIVEGDQAETLTLNLIERINKALVGVH